MIVELPSCDQPIKLIQLTDCHLGKVAGEALLSMDTDHSLEAVIDSIQAQHAHFDLLLATGDIANHASQSAYQRFAQLTGQLTKHQFWLPGNHDDPEVMQQVLGGPLIKAVKVANWLIILLDSTVRGYVGGEFSRQELDLLQQLLAGHRQEHVLICLHHHPVDINCQWLDEQRLKNAEDFFTIVDRHDNVRGILWGHIHQHIDQLRGDVQLMATPSTCIQFAPYSENFQLDNQSPGYRSLELHPDGQINTAVFRVEDYPVKVDLQDSTGY